MSIILHDITYHHPDRTPLFERLNCSVESGGHVNLIGNNGAGKSTLLQIMAGGLAPSEGSVVTSSRPYYVPQQLGALQAQTVAGALRAGAVFRATRDFAISSGWMCGLKVRVTFIFND